jgi:hypothetical protein
LKYEQNFKNNLKIEKIKNKFEIWKNSKTIRIWTKFWKTNLKFEQKFQKIEIWKKSKTILKIEKIKNKFEIWKIQKQFEYEQNFQKQI